MAAGPVSRLGSFEPGIKQGCGSHHTCTKRKHSYNRGIFFEKVVRARSTYRSTDSYYRRI